MARVASRGPEEGWDELIQQPSSEALAMSQKIRRELDQEMEVASPSSLIPPVHDCEAGVVDSVREQDENMGKLFIAFLEDFEISPEQYEDVADELELMGLERHEVLGAVLGEDLGGSRSHYVRIAKHLLDHQGGTLRVHLPFVMSWDPGATDVQAGEQLYCHIVNYFHRVLEVFGEKVMTWANKLGAEMHCSSGRTNRLYLNFSAKQSQVLTLRQLRAEGLGKLVTVRAQVTRTSDIRPELRWSTFRCLDCQNLVRHVRQEYKYHTPTKCPHARCTNTFNWEMVRSDAIYGDWQKLRVQEGIHDNSFGSLPRSMDVILRNDTVGEDTAGQPVLMTGCLLPVPDLPSLLKPGEMPRTAQRHFAVKKSEIGNVAEGLTGTRQYGVRDLSHRICFLATQVQSINSLGIDARHNDHAPGSEDNANFVSGAELLSDPAAAWLAGTARAPNTLDILARSVAPRIKGKDDVKKGILLMLVGGVAKNTAAAKLRGDINVLLLGDPGTAKSQFLRWIDSFHPKAVLASGKGSTAAGLTAAVHRDTQGETVLDAGALVYADQGICCIDEFDKMDLKDRSAIHEAMEQQTISIAKAGIQATLNARASVVASCNPRFGRYNTAKSFQVNVGLPAPILSRFDLLFTIIDEADPVVDRQVAVHLTSNFLPEPLEDLSRQGALTQDELRLHIECARQVKPLMRARAKRKIANLYVNLRRNMADSNRCAVRGITVRQLESLIRLSEAVARLKFSDYVEEAHVEEASVLFRQSLFKIVAPRQVTVQRSDGTTERMAADEFQRISLRLTDRIEEMMAQKEFEEAGVLVQELIEWYLEWFLVDAGESELGGWSSRMWNIIQTLVNVEYVLIATEAGDAERMRVAVHPNYAGLGSFSRGPTEGRSIKHATFAYRSTN